MPDAGSESPLFHLAVAAEWRRAEDEGAPYRRSTIETSLEEAGFIHCSFAHQVQGTADRFYRGRDDIVLLVIDPARVGSEVRVEGGGEQFPHIYGPLPLDAVIETLPVPVDQDGRLLITSLVQGA
jgi:uncharacterized protein (DUF952 family)